MNKKWFQKSVLLFSIVTTGFCGMVAEFSISTLTSYLMGNTIASWSITIVLMMAAMAAGGLLTSRVHDEGDLLSVFIKLELCLSFCCSSAVMFIYNMDVYDWTELSIGISCILIGMLIGAEIPILSRLMNAHGLVYKKNIPWVLAGDYVGSLIGGFTFAYFFVPVIGLVYTPIILGSLNGAVAFIMFIAMLRPHAEISNPWEGLVKSNQPTPVQRPGWLILLFSISLLWLLAAFWFSPTIIMFATQELYDDPIILEKQTRYQQLTLTQNTDPNDRDLRLFLNGGLQFSSSDEYRYHEGLTHPALLITSTNLNRPFDVLLLGGGDGLAVREIRKHFLCNSITLVDLDQEMTDLFSGECENLNGPTEVRACKDLAQLNQYSLSDPRVSIVNTDAFNYLKNPDNPKYFDVIIVDLPDPYAIEINKLYTREFFRLIRERLTPGGAMAIQSTSPFHSGDAFQCITKTLRAAGFSVVPYWINIPSFGEWGFNIGVDQSRLSEDRLKKELEEVEITISTRWLNQEALTGAIRFGKDIFVNYESIQINTLVEPKLLDYYVEGWQEE